MVPRVRLFLLLLFSMIFDYNVITAEIKKIRKRQAVQNEVINLQRGGQVRGIGGANTPAPTRAGEMIRMALEDANSELQFQKQLDRQMLLQGIDEAPGGHSYFWHLGSFLYTKNREKVTALSDKAWVSVQVTKKLTKMTGMTVAQLQQDPEILSEWRRQVAGTCPFQIPTCTPMAMVYRKADGSCNNLNDIPMGAAYTRQRRMMDNSYDDAMDTPRINGVTGDPLPSPRLISNVIHKAGECSIASSRLTVLVMQFAQFMEHDVISTPMITGEDGADIMCCETPPEITARRAACFPIEIPPHDERFKEHCMTFSRSTPGLHPNCDIDIRSPMNQATAWMDSSQVYGTELNETIKLRAGVGGLMNMTVRGLPPESDEELCVKEEPGDYCMAAGDFRVNHVPGLTVMHVIFLRMHNRIAMKLSLINPSWTDEKLFQETRKIVVAIQQHIVYNHLFPKIFDEGTMIKYGLYSAPQGYNTVYDPSVDGSIMMGFSAAAMRFPHTRIPDVQSMVNQMFNYRLDIPIFNTFDKPKFVLQKKGNALNDFARWLISFPAMEDDRHVEDGVRDFLFLDKRGHSFDLVALNIQRARDQGIPPYNHWRQLCGLPPAHYFASVEGGLVDHTPEVATLLATVYHDVNDIDLFTGGISEKQIPGSALGPTFSCIIASQFQDLKKSDRFWYENQSVHSGFTEAQLNEIKKMTLSKIMCNHLDLPKIQRDPFTFATERNPRVACEEIPDINFGHWKSEA